MKKRIISLLVVSAMLLTAAGCKKEDETQTSQTTAQTGITPVNGDSFETWKDIDRNKVIAYVEGADPEKFDITFGEFYSEYLYYLLSYNINDDMSAKYKEACESYREDIITYITFEHIFLEVAEEMGCGISSLTEEEKATIQNNIDATVNSFISNYNSAASAELGEDATQDDILNRSTELLLADLERAELTMDIFEKWETNSFIQEKLAAELTKDVTVTDEEVDKMFEEYVAMAKDAYENDRTAYETNQTYTWIYKPEGTRLADQILISFSDETRTAINEARQAGKADEAERIRKEAYDAVMQEKVNDIIALIEGGTDFNSLQETYNEDGSNDAYSVIKDSALYVSEFTDAVFSIEEVGGIAEPAISDYGVHIIMYAGDAVVTEEDLTEIKASMKDYIVYNKGNEIQEAAYDEWLERYPYTIDYDLLKVTVDVTPEDVANQ